MLKLKYKINFEPYNFFGQVLTVNCPKTVLLMTVPAPYPVQEHRWQLYRVITGILLFEEGLVTKY